MKYIRYLVRYLVTLAQDVFFIPLVLLIHLVWGKNLRMEGLCVCTTLRRESWLLNRFGSLPLSGWLAKLGFCAICFGHAIVYVEEADGYDQIHEHVHEHQAEASMFKSLLAGLIVLLVTDKLWLSYVIWASGYILYLLANCLIAFIRGENAYFGNVHEEHAWAVEGALWNEKTAEHYRQVYKKTL